jgi:hypothetical protein
MSAMNAHAPGVPDQPWEAPRRDPDLDEPAVPSNRSTVIEILQEVVPLVLFVPVAGPPAILLVGPLLLLALLLIPPAAVLITLVAVLLLGAGLLAAIGTLIASPYLLVRHLHARQAARRRRLAPVTRPARPALTISEVAAPRVGRPVHQPGGSGLVHLTTR